jgi:hypothetical protein
MTSLAGPNPEFPLGASKRFRKMNNEEASCSTCGAPRPSDQARCPVCGDTHRTYQIASHIQLSTNVIVLTTIVQTVWKWSWRLVVFYAAIQFLWAVVSFWTNGWISVGWSVAGSVVSTVVGFFIVEKVITKTSD